MPINHEWMQETIQKIDLQDSKDSRWDKQHYLSVASICGCNNCYSCAVRQWDKQKKTVQS